MGAGDADAGPSLAATTAGFASASLDVTFFAGLAGGACLAGFPGEAAAFFTGLVAAFFTATFFTAAAFFATTFFGAFTFFAGVFPPPRAGAPFKGLAATAFFFATTFLTAAAFLPAVLVGFVFFAGADLDFRAGLAADLPDLGAVGFFLAMSRRVQSAVGQGSQKPSPTK